MAQSYYILQTHLLGMIFKPNIYKWFIIIIIIVIHIFVIEIKESY